MSTSNFDVASDFKVFKGNEILTTVFPPRQFIIESFLREKDTMIIAGPPKIGKSIFTLQMILSLLSGEPFLEHYEVRKTCKVFYIQLEGTLDDTQDRLKRMITSIPFKQENFAMLFSAPLLLEDINHCKTLTEKINPVFKPDILVIDPVYFAMGKSLSDDEAVRSFIGNLRRLQDYYKCAIILIHHTHKRKFDPKSKHVIDEGDDAVFGSVFFQAFVTHQLLLQKDEKAGMVDLFCNLQRSGDVIKKITLILRQPVPLYFTEFDLAPSMINILMASLPSDWKTAREIYETAKIPKPTFYRDIKQLIDSQYAESQISVSNGRETTRLFRKQVVSKVVSNILS